LKEWRCQPDEMVEIGREIAIMTVDAASAPAPTRTEPAAPPSNLSLQNLQRVPRATPTLPASLPPALAPAITKRLASVVPANMQLDAPWKAIRAAREHAKQHQLDLSPSLMLAWCVTRAMERHAAFRRLVQPDGSIAEQTPFDLGIAVALDGDRLATAWLRGAAQLDWPGFARAYAAALADARVGKIEEVQAPLNLTSLGAFGIEQATPIVVPPAMGTFFVGTAHEKMINDRGAVYPAEVVTLSLTFDHRVVNGAGAAAFLRDVKAQIENFALPTEK
jgi:pyruvate/2-oxoglutarate dehydrogenase complex dihydrolipoamide acyltransferase (E2) component